jgi:L-threonylcarbamoyladenylate synthase
VAFPTETVYGLGANAESEEAVAAIYRAKNRPADHPLIVHLAHPGDIAHFAQEVPDFARALMRDFWPGPMTLILQRTDNAKDFITGGQSTVGVRIPNHPVALALLLAFKNLGGRGIAAPSANRYGAVSPTNARAVEIELGEYLDAEDMILDGGPSDVGLESTIIDCTGPAPKILRPGAITAAMIEESTGMVVADAFANTIRVSGSHAQHYSPRAKVVIGGNPAAGEGLIAKDQFPTPLGAIRLAAPQTDEEFAAILYSALRAADEQNLVVVYVLPPEGEGIAIAIRDRVQRAAAG